MFPTYPSTTPSSLPTAFTPEHAVQAPQNQASLKFMSRDINAFHAVQAPQNQASLKRPVTRARQLHREFQAAKVSPDQTPTSPAWGSSRAKPNKKCAMRTPTSKERKAPLSATARLTARRNEQYDCEVAGGRLIKHRLLLVGWIIRYSLLLAIVGALLLTVLIHIVAPWFGVQPSVALPPLHELWPWVGAWWRLLNSAQS